MTRGRPTLLPALSPWPATLTCPSLELQAESISELLCLELGCFGQ